MDLVKFGKHWEIETHADYDRAMEALEGADFCAMMCDDYQRECRERAEVAKQKAEVVRMAKAKGII